MNIGLFILALIFDFALWRSPFEWGATYRHRPEINLLLSGLFYASVIALIFIEMRGRLKIPAPRLWPGPASYAVLAFVCLLLGSFSFVIQFTSVHVQEPFHQAARLWMSGSLLFLAIGYGIRRRASQAKRS